MSRKKAFDLKTHVCRSCGLDQVMPFYKPPLTRGSRGELRLNLTEEFLHDFEARTRVLTECSSCESTNVWSYWNPDPTAKRKELLDSLVHEALREIDSLQSQTFATTQRILEHAGIRLRPEIVEGGPIKLPAWLRSKNLPVESQIHAGVEEPTPTPPPDATASPAISGHGVRSWAQAELQRCQVLSAREIAWEFVGRGMAPNDALSAARGILAELQPPLAGGMERSGWGGAEHSELKRRAYRRVASEFEIDKVWVDMEVPYGFRPSVTPSRPRSAHSDWNMLPRPDLFFETTRGRIWVECQTSKSQQGLRKKAEYARRHPEVYDVFVLESSGLDSRLVGELRRSVEAAGHRFIGP